MSKGEFYPMDYEAWDEGTDSLTLEEEGAYLRICHQMYRRNGAIPNNANGLSRIWRCHPNKAKKLLQTLIEMGKVEVTSGGSLTNKKVGSTLDDMETRRRRARDAGKTGGTRSGEIRSKALINNAPNEAPASTSTNEIEPITRHNITEQKNRDNLEPSAASDSGGDALTKKLRHYHEILSPLIGEKMHPNAVWHCGEIHGWIEDGASFELDVIPTIVAKVNAKPGYFRSLGLMAADVAASKKRREAGLPEVNLAATQKSNVLPMDRTVRIGPDFSDEEVSRSCFNAWRKNKTYWNGAWDYPPDDPRCKIPKEWLDAWLAEKQA